MMERMGRRGFLRFSAAAGLGTVAAACAPTSGPTQGSGIEAAPVDEEGVQETMRFIAFADQDLGIRGVVPEGWAQERPGEFTRGAHDGDPTVLVQQLISGVSADQLQGLLLPRLGLEALPESAGHITTPRMAWDLYTVEGGDPNAGPTVVDIALSEAGDGAGLVLLVTTPDEHDALHYSVFLRAVDAFAPITVGPAAAEAGRSVAAPEKTEADVLLVVGAPLENDACEVVAELLERELGVSTAYVDLDALGEADFHGAQLLFFPGGECASVQLPEKACRKVRAAVAAGMGYIGICCGAFLAAEASTMASHWQIGGSSFGILPGMAETAGGEFVRPFYVDVQHPLVANASVVDRIAPVMQLRFVGGTTNLAPSYADGLQNWCVATLDAPRGGMHVGKRAVMTATLFGKGRVFLSGPHPEARADTRPLLVAAAEWCTRRSGPASDQLPIVEASIPATGVVDQFYICSATGSHDPEGYPIGFIWDFGDGSPKQYRPEAIHIYRQPGQYTATLTVTTGARHRLQSVQVSVGEP